MSHAAPRMAFDLSEYESRLARTRTWMADSEIELLVLTQPEHYNWLTGYDPTAVFYYQPLFITADPDVEPILFCNKTELTLCRETCCLDDVRIIWTYEDQVARTVEVIRELGFGDAPFRCGLSLSSYHLKPTYAFGLTEALPKLQAVDVSPDLDDLRLVKSDAEVAYLREAASIADRGVMAGIDACAEGVLDSSVMAEIQREIAANGCEFPAFPTLVDARGSLHGTPIGQSLEAGKTVYLEVSGVSRRYHCNISRTVSIGEPTEQVAKMAELISSCIEAATAIMKPGTPVSKIVDLVDEYREGYADASWGRVGFSMEIAYPPIWIGGLSLMRGDEHVLEPGMVITIEPGLGQIDGLTLVLGNNVLITEGEPDVLNEVPTQLFVR